MLVPDHLRTGSSDEDDECHDHKQGYRYTDSDEDCQLVAGWGRQNGLGAEIVECWYSIALSSEKTKTSELLSSTMIWCACNFDLYNLSLPCDEMCCI